MEPLEAHWLRLAQPHLLGQAIQKAQLEVVLVAAYLPLQLVEMVLLVEMLVNCSFQ
jgi:hypothetical protein